jgi:hypothetical protein
MHKDKFERTHSMDSDSSPDTSPTTEEIAARAYEIYLEGGCADGHDLENWLQAEAELTEKYAKPAARSAKAKSA